MGTLAKTQRPSKWVLWQDPNKMLAEGGISSGSALFAIEVKTIFRKSNTSFDRILMQEWQPLKIQNGQFYTYCINMYGIIHQNEKGCWAR